MSLSQLEDLTAYLQAYMPPRSLQFFDADMVSGEMIRSTKALGLGRYRLGIIRYTAVLAWLGFPFREYPPALIYAHVMAWIEERQNQLANELNLPPPRIDPAFDHERAADLMIDIEMVDEITVIEDPQGDIHFNGKRWSLEPPKVYTATEFEIVATVARADD